MVSVCRSVKMLSQNQRFSLGKAHASVFSFPNYPHLIHKIIHTNKTIHNLPITLWITTLTPHTTTLLLSPHTPHDTTPTTLKPSNITYNKTLYISNITILQHTKNPLELKIEPCRTMLYFKGQN